MAEEIDEKSYYREDFTTESEWEVFTSSLVEIFQKYELSNGDWGEGNIFDCEWKIQTESVNLLRSEIAISYYAAQIKQAEGNDAHQAHPMHFDLMSPSNTFADKSVSSELHTLARLYGLRRFVVLHPLKNTQYLTNPAEFSFFLSAATVVATDVGSAVPIFVQIYDPKWNFYLGVGAAPSMRTNFDLVALENGPADLRYLSGLLTLFKEKLPGSYVHPARVSVRNTYALDTIKLRIPMNIPFTKEPALTTDDDVALRSSQFIALPSGYFPDSCVEMFSVYIWSELTENTAIDSVLRSDFVPSKAQKGSIQLVVHATSYLSRCLRDFQKLCGASEQLEYYVGRNFSGAKRPSPSTPTPPKRLHGPMNDNELNLMLYYLFPEKTPEVCLFPYSTEAFKAEFNPHRVKSAASDSLVSRLSCLLATCNAHFGGKNGLAQLWAAFTRELRALWDDFAVVSGVEAGMPDTRTCVLHQKLQMLNVCRERHKSSEFGAAVQDVQIEPSPPTDDEGEDEFYDCSTEEDQATKAAAEEPPQADEAPEVEEPKAEVSEGEMAADQERKAEEREDSERARPEGRQRRLGSKKLLAADEYLYVPITQEPVPKTEDQLHDDAAAMLKLGPGSGLTSEMMSTSLLSDMEAFKAANPRGQMEDFIRWYSPNDWLEAESGDGRGQLSVRMQAPDNTWQRIWRQAQPKPIWRQKRLFDDTLEALKVLQYLETRSIGEIYELMLVPLLHAAVLKLKDLCHNAQVLDVFGTQFDALLADLCRLSRDVEIVGQTATSFVMQMPSPEHVIAQIEQLERQLYQFKCFERFCGYPKSISREDVNRQFAEMVQSRNSCQLSTGLGSGGDGASMLSPNFRPASNLISKDYVIRVDSEATSLAKGKLGPQFLRAIITGDQIRLCGAFTENTTFV